MPEHGHTRMRELCGTHYILIDYIHILDKRSAAVDLASCIYLRYEVSSLLSTQTNQVHEYR